MDVEHERLDALLKKTDLAFKDLLNEPDSLELKRAYESAKNELNEFLGVMRTSMKERYRNF